MINLRYFNPVGAHKSGLLGEDAGPSPKNIFPCLTKTAYGRMKEVVIFGNDYKTPDGTGKHSLRGICCLKRLMLVSNKVLSQRLALVVWSVFEASYTHQ